jgi:hypothetical protein
VPGLGGDLVRVGEGTNGGHDRGASSWMDGMEPNDFAVRLSHFGYHHTTSLLVWSQHHRAGDSKSVTLLSKEEEEKLLYTGGQCCIATAWACDLIFMIRGLLQLVASPGVPFFGTPLAMQRRPFT